MDTKVCSKCQLSKPVSEYAKYSGRKDGLQPRCKLCQASDYQANREHRLKLAASYYQANRDRINEYKATVKGRAKRLVNQAMHRATARGFDFDLDWQFVAELLESTPVCPLLGLELERVNGKGRLPNSPSLDRIDSSKGYTKDNVWIISLRANTIKNDATLEELALMAHNWSKAAFNQVSDRSIQTGCH